MPVEEKACQWSFFGAKMWNSHISYKSEDRFNKSLIRKNIVSLSEKVKAVKYLENYSTIALYKNK